MVSPVNALTGGILAVGGVVGLAVAYVAAQHRDHPAAGPLAKMATLAGLSGLCFATLALAPRIQGARALYPWREGQRGETQPRESRERGHLRQRTGRWMVAVLGRHVGDRQSDNPSDCQYPPRERVHRGYHPIGVTPRPTSKLLTTDAQVPRNGVSTVRHRKLDDTAAPYGRRGPLEPPPRPFRRRGTSPSVAGPDGPAVPASGVPHQGLPRERRWITPQGGQVTGTVAQVVTVVPQWGQTSSPPSHRGLTIQSPWSGFSWPQSGQNSVAFGRGGASASPVRGAVRGLVIPDVGTGDL